MSARSIGQIVAGVAPAKARRTFQPVRRNSYHAGEREHRLWRPIDKKEISVRLKAAELYDRIHKQAGKKNGALGHIGLEVLRELYRIADRRTGRCEPAIETIMRKIRRSRAAVVAAMARLKEHGFLDWIRRTEPTENEGAGPQVRQITNAYGFGLPKAAAALLKRVMGKSPPPDDDTQRRRQAHQDTEAMFATVPLSEIGTARTGPSELGDALDRLGAALGRSASSLDGQNPATEVNI